MHRIMSVSMLLMAVCAGCRDRNLSGRIEHSLGFFQEHRSEETDVISALLRAKADPGLLAKPVLIKALFFRKTNRIFLRWMEGVPTVSVMRLKSASGLMLSFEMHEAYKAENMKDSKTGVDYSYCEVLDDADTAELARGTWVAELVKEDGTTSNQVPVVAATRGLAPPGNAGSSPGS